MKLLDIFGETVDNVRESHRDWMVAHGVSRLALYRGPAIFGVARILPEGRNFQFVEDGSPAVIVPVCNSYELDDFEEGLVDLLAFLPKAPSRWWVLRDVLPVLNASAVSYARPCMGIDYPLTVNTTPLGWLQRDREGVVILDWSCCIQLWLGGVTRVLCDTPTLSSKLAKALAEPVLTTPEIRVEGVRNAA